MKRLTVCMFVLLNARVVLADEVFNCSSTMGASITWELGGMMSKAGLKAKTNSDPMTVTLVFQGKHLLIKGNAGQATATKVADNMYVETDAESLPVWKVIPASNVSPMTVFQFKGYGLAGPVSYLVAWECR